MLRLRCTSSAHRIRTDKDTLRGIHHASFVPSTCFFIASRARVLRPCHPSESHRFMVRLVSIETFSNRNRIHLLSASRPFPIPIDPVFFPNRTRTCPLSTPVPTGPTHLILFPRPESSISLERYRLGDRALVERRGRRGRHGHRRHWRHVCARTWQANMAGFASAPAFRAASRVRVGVTAAVPSTKELRELSDADVEERVAKAKRRLLDLRIKKATRQVRRTRRGGIRSLRGCSDGSTDARTSPCAAGVQTARVCGEQEGGTIHVRCQLVPPCKLALNSKTRPRLPQRCMKSGLNSG